MGNGNGRMLFVHIVKNMLRARGAKVGHQQWCNFLEFVKKVCPRFPEEGTVYLGTWKKVREKLQDYYDVHAPGKVPVDTFSLWTLIRDSLDPRHERVKAGESQRGEEIRDNIGDVLPFEKENETRPTAPPERSCGKPFDLMVTKDGEEPLSPGDAKQLEEEAPWFHNYGGYFPVVEAASSDHTSKELEKVVQGLQTAVQQLTLQLGGLQKKLKGPSKDTYPPPPFEEPQLVIAVVKQPRGPEPLSPLQTT